MRIQLIHWRADEAGPLVSTLSSGGHQVHYRPDVTSAQLREWRRSPPEVFVIDLSRLPSHGREVAVGLRENKATRQIPIVFVNGEPAKVEATRRFLPDAVYAESAGVLAAIEQAVLHPPAEPAAPPGIVDRYGGRTVAQKLGIRPGSTVAVLDPPADYSTVIGELPPRATLVENPAGDCAVTLWFVHDPDHYRFGLARAVGLADRTRLWILWRKQASRRPGPDSVNQALVRELALDAGLVDYKVCAAGETWSALAFARRKT